MQRPVLLVNGNGYGYNEAFEKCMIWEAPGLGTEAFIRFPANGQLEMMVFSERGNDDFFMRRCLH